MTALSIDLERATAEGQAKASASKLAAARVPKGKNAQAGVVRALKKISDDSNAELFSGKAAHAAFGHLRRA